MGISQDLYRKAKELIPGGTQLLSKRPEMFLPDYWPSYYDKSKGCEVWDLDGIHYYDFSYMGIGACILGYSDADIDKAVMDAVKRGNMNTLNAPEEIKLAEMLIDLHPWADMVRYARTGGESMAVAVRIARAYSKKDIVMFSGYHGWHDWYIASNLADDSSLDGHLLPGLKPSGVPRLLLGAAVPFKYNDTQEFLVKFNNVKSSIGAIVLETIRNDQPEKEFLETIKKIAKSNNIPLVLDEITAGFRLNLGGAHLLYDIDPDIAVFAKGISNGFPMAAIIGKKNVMQAAQDSFISSVYWTDRIGPSAAIATIEKMEEKKVQEHLSKIGKKLKSIWMDAAKINEIKIKVTGIDPLAHFEFDYPNSLEIKTLFTQIMLKKGFLASTAFYASFAHAEELAEKYRKAVEDTFLIIAEAIKNNNVKDKLNGPVCHSGFLRLN